MRRYLLYHSRAQSLAVIALFLALMFLLIGLAVDGGMIYVQRRLMQNTADAACLAASNKIALGKADGEAQTAAQQVIANNLGTTPGAGVNAPGTLAYGTINELYTPIQGSGIGLTRGITVTNSDVRVALQSPANTYFMGVAGIRTYTVAARAHCNAAAGGGGSPFAVARWRATPTSSGLTTDLALPQFTNSHQLMIVSDVLAQNGSATVSEWPGWADRATNGYPGDPPSNNYCCLYSQPSATATITNPGPLTPIAGNGAAANGGATSFVGSVVLDYRQITFPEKLVYNGLTATSNVNTFKDYATKYILGTYPGPLVTPGQQIAYYNGVSAGQVVAPFDQRYNPGDIVTVLVYNGTIYGNPSYKVYYPTSPADNQQQSRGSPSFSSQFPTNCDFQGADPSTYIFDGTVVDGHGDNVTFTPTSYQVKVEPETPPGGAAPIRPYKLRAFLSADSSTWGQVKGRWQRSGGWSSGWQSFNLNGTAPTISVDGNLASTQAFTFDIQQSERGDCSFSYPDPISPTLTISGTVNLPIRKGGAQTLYLEAESNGQRRAVYALLNMGAASGDFYAYFPGPIAYDSLTPGGATATSDFIIRTVGGTNLLLNDLPAAPTLKWFSTDLNPIAAPVGITAQLKKKTGGPGGAKNQLEIDVDNTAATGEEYYVRIEVAYGGRSHWAWYYVAVPTPASSSVDSFVYALGYASFKIETIDSNSIWGRAVSGLATKPKDIKIGLLPRLIPWEQ